ncbi:CapA family protein [Allobacillus sp. GCM10007491]|uniref:CapA family protein n=1 Tax=Allobacillus saliphilus TaxID=2912308 RepID=A0A941CX25_9BACI|nr:CapA family protein [Allobacillus saliphilus]MBR7554759.1 CapA family protein [Allobacillus saliphilus]
MAGKNKVVSLAATGDILLHGRVYGGTKKKSDYKLKEQLQNVNELLVKQDITVVNLESIIAGQEIGLSSFPKFNAPVELGYVLKDMGVDIASIANNHALDRGEEALKKSINNLKKIGLEYVGAHNSFEDRDTLRIINKNGLRVCFLSYTKDTNGIVKALNTKPYLVNSLTHTKLISIIREIRRIKRNEIADVVVVNMHFGEEYHLEPSSAQREISASLADAGADIILGHHPHVLQPPEWIETSRGTKTFVAYSLGNFFTGQNGLHRQIGSVLTLDIRKPSKTYDNIEISNPTYNLTFVERTKPKKYVIHLFRDWIKNNKHIETKYGRFSPEDVYKDTVARLRKSISNLNVK